MLGCATISSLLADCAIADGSSRTWRLTTYALVEMEKRKRAFPFPLNGYTVCPLDESDSRHRKMQLQLQPHCDSDSCQTAPRMLFLFVARPLLSLEVSDHCLTLALGRECPANSPLSCRAIHSKCSKRGFPLDMRSTSERAKFQ